MTLKSKILPIKILICIFLFIGVFNASAYGKGSYPVKKGIDVSFWQGDINWKEVKSSGISFAMIREGYGTRHSGKVDKMFHRNIRNAKANGIMCGVYHYSYARSVNEAYAEADFCIDNIKGYKLEYPVALDIEDESLKYLGKRILTNICKAFCKRVRQRGYYPIIYSNLDWFTNRLDRDELVEYDIWLARWKVSDPKYSCGIWQYSDCGRVSGICGDVDMDFGYIDYYSIIKRLGLNGF